VCVTKEGVSAPDRSLEKSANAFLMSDDVRRREERVSRRARKPKPKPKGKETPNRRRFAPRRQLELILRNQQNSAAEADQGLGGV
jgi:hypothetical protein